MRRRENVECGQGRYAQWFDTQLSDRQSVVIDKTVAAVTSRDPAIASPALGALNELADAKGGFVGLLTGHEAAWRRLWERFGITIEGDREAQLADFQVHYRGQRIDAWLDPTRLEFAANPCHVAAPVHVEVAGESTTIRPGETLAFTLGTCNDS